MLATNTTIVELDLSDNQLRSIPEELAHLPALKWLDLRNNELNELPESLVLLANKLEELYLEGNYFDDLERDKILLMLPNTQIYFDTELY